MTKPLSHSFSSIKMFDNCPKRYFHQRIEKSVVDPPNEATQYGERVHEAIELYMKGEAPDLTSEASKHQQMVDRIMQSAGSKTILVEQELTLTRDLQPTGWWDEDAWFRSKLDVLILDGDRAIDIDWKTGKRRPDFFQLGLFAMQTFIHYPDINEVDSAFVWLKEGAMDKKTYKREHLPSLLELLTSKTTRIEQALAKDTWPARPSGLCGWCPCKNTCPYSNKR